MLLLAVIASLMVQPCVNINTAGPQELLRIVHVEPGIVDDLIALRPFYRVGHLVLVPGIFLPEMRDIVEQGLACV